MTARETQARLAGALVESALARNQPGTPRASPHSEFANCECAYQAIGLKR